MPRIITGSNLFTTCVTLDAADSIITASTQPDIPPVVPADSDTGEQLIDEAFQAMVADWEEAIDHITTYFDEHDPADIWEQAFGGDTLIRLDFHTIGTRNDHPIRLYDHKGQGITDRERLDAVRNKQQSHYEARPEDNPHRDKTVYVVPVHAYW